MCGGVRPELAKGERVSVSVGVLNEQGEREEGGGGRGG